MRTRAAADTRRFDALLRRYVRELQVRRCSPSSIAKARSELPRLFHHLSEEGITDPRAVSEEHLVDYVRKLSRRTTRTGEPLASWSRSAAVSTVRRFFTFLEAREVILRNPAASIPLPKASRTPRGILSEARARRLMTTPPTRNAIGKRDRAILETLYGTGIRMMECVRLDVIDVDFAQGTVRVREGKGRKDRLVPLPRRARLALRAYLEESRPELEKASHETALFLSRAGTRLSGAGLRLRVKRHGLAAGANVSCHV
ncbi:MAG: tyrosine-type recombinase/integrase, partial [Thermoleophilia bacterium]|nr:tyrosine-type recombinase/integrase [Thermoleophilia bacterium]